MSSGQESAHARVIERLRTQADDVRRLCAGLDDAALSTRTVPGKWSLKELACHVWRVQEIFRGRLDAMLEQDEPPLSNYEPEGDAVFEKMAAGPASEPLTQFFADRSALIERLQHLTPAQWHRAGRHAEYPRYDVHFAMEYLAFHEGHHIYQMFQRRSPLGRLPD